MFANFTEETCTGTGNTLALAGITTGNIVFSESYADGDPVAYVLEDSGGVIKIAGVGTYVSATDDITRADTWNWNGTVIDDNPSSNITLSGGTHTVRVDVVEDDLVSGGVDSGRIYLTPLVSEIVQTVSVTNDIIYYTPLPLAFSGFYDAFSFEVTGAGGGSSVARLGLYTSNNGIPDQLIAVRNTDVSVSSTGLIETPFDGGSTFIRKGNYYTAITFEQNPGSIRCCQSDSSSHTQLGASAINVVSATAFQSQTFGNLATTAVTSSFTYTNLAHLVGIVGT